MPDDNTQPIIVKKIKKGGHGAHGGAWKIAYADFVTAMMAFFLLMWLVGSTTKEEKQAIADFFNNPSAVPGGKGGGSPTVDVGGGKNITFAAGNTKEGPNPNKTKTTISPPSTEVGEITKLDKQRLLELKKELENTIDASEALRPFKDQLMLEITKEGLRIQIIDKENRPMFASGSSSPLPYAAQLLKEIGAVINHVPNRISLSGHTDATPYAIATAEHYSNWELSADRANAARRALQDGGMDKDKVARVVGLSSAVLLDKQNPLNPANRRISIMVLNKDAEESLLHDEGKLDQTTEEASVPSKPAASPKLPDNPIPKPQVASEPKPAAPAQTPSPVPATPLVPSTTKPLFPALAPVAPAKTATKPEIQAAPKAPTVSTKPFVTPIAPISPIVAPIPLPVVAPKTAATGATVAKTTVPLAARTQTPAPASATVTNTITKPSTQATPPATVPAPTRTETKPSVQPAPITPAAPIKPLIPQPIAPVTPIVAPVPLPLVSPAARAAAAAASAAAATEEAKQSGKQ